MGIDEDKKYLKEEKKIINFKVAIKYRSKKKRSIFSYYYRFKKLKIKYVTYGPPCASKLKFKLKLKKTNIKYPSKKYYFKVRQREH